MLLVATLHPKGARLLAQLVLKLTMLKTYAGVV